MVVNSRSEASKIVSDHINILMSDDNSALPDSAPERFALVLSFAAKSLSEYGYPADLIAQISTNSALITHYAGRDAMAEAILLISGND